MSVVESGRVDEELWRAKNRRFKWKCYRPSRAPLVANAKNHTPRIWEAGKQINKVFQPVILCFDPL